jgi:hypothetical protein
MPERSEAFAFITEFQPRKGLIQEISGVTAIQRAFRDRSGLPEHQRRFAHQYSILGSQRLQAAIKNYSNPA